MSTWCTGNSVTVREIVVLLPTSNTKGRAYDKNMMRFIFEILSLLFNSFYNFCSMRNDWRFVRIINAWIKLN